MCKYLRVISIKDSIPLRETTLAVLLVLYYYFTFYQKKNSRRFNRNPMEKCCTDTSLLKTNLPEIFQKRKRKEKQVLPVATDSPNRKTIY